MKVVKLPVSSCGWWRNNCELEITSLKDAMWIAKAELREKIPLGLRGRVV